MYSQEGSWYFAMNQVFFRCSQGTWREDLVLETQNLIPCLRPGKRKVYLWINLTVSKLELVERDSIYLELMNVPVYTSFWRKHTQVVTSPMKMIRLPHSLGSYELWNHFLGNFSGHFRKIRLVSFYFGTQMSHILFDGDLASPAGAGWDGPIVPGTITRQRG